MAVWNMSKMYDISVACLMVVAMFDGLHDIYDTVI